MLSTESAYGPTLLLCAGEAKIKTRNVDSDLETFTAVQNWQVTNLYKSLNSVVKGDLDNNRLVLDYISIELGDVCRVGGSSCCTYSNPLSQRKTNINNVTQQASWLQKTIWIIEFFLHQRLIPKFIFLDIIRNQI